jgi:hypothetical protein
MNPHRVSDSSRITKKKPAKREKKADKDKNPARRLQYVSPANSP